MHALIERATVCRECAVKGDGHRDYRDTRRKKDGRRLRYIGEDGRKKMKKKKLSMFSTATTMPISRPAHPIKATHLFLLFLCLSLSCCVDRHECIINHFEIRRKWARRRVEQISNFLYTGWSVAGSHLSFFRFYFFDFDHFEQDLLFLCGD